MGGNPVRYTDPSGQFVPALVWCATNALCVGGVVIIVASVINADGDHSPWSPNPDVNTEYIRDRDALKDSGYTKIPYQDPNDPKCEEIQKRIDDINRELNGRQSFTNKWFGGLFNGGHAKRVKILTDERDKYQRRLDRGDCRKCP